MNKKTFKNSELEEILNHAAHLGSYAMPGGMTLAVIDARKKLKNAFESFNEACKQVGETRCEKCKEGKPVTEYQRDEHGKELIDLPKKLKFKDKKTEEAALAELRNLADQVVEMEVRSFDRAAVEELKSITPIQLEAIAALVHIREN